MLGKELNEVCLGKNMAKKFMQTSMLLTILPKKPGITLNAYTRNAFVVGLWLNGFLLIKFPNFSTFI